MNRKTIAALGACMVLSLSLASVSNAGVSEEEAAKLGNELTPLGGEKNGNAEGTIPAWTGGIQSAPEGYKTGDHHPDPFADDKILFTITGENYQQYEDKLSPGQIAMLKKYPTFKMNVYQSRRTASFPNYVYEATKKNAVTASLYKGGDSIENAIIGTPFPIPSNGLEVIWNHLLRYRGESVRLYDKNIAPLQDGTFTPVSRQADIDFLYAHKGATIEGLNNAMLNFKQTILGPARLAGGVILVKETLNQVEEPRKAWTYNPGQRRVRLAPNIAYDNPGSITDGLSTSDNYDVFNGATDRYDWKLIGKQEMYVPYNSYKLHSDQIKSTDIIRPGHLNPDFLRYELHRVWVVEASLKEGMSNIYKKRVFYFDEDSWSILVADHYDNRDNLWRVIEAYVINYYEVPTIWSTLESNYDLQSGRYTALGFDNETEMIDFSVEFKPSDFRPAALRTRGRR